MRYNWKAVLATVAVLSGLGVQAAQAIDFVWDGGNGGWDEAKWNGGQDLLTLIGNAKGSNGEDGGNLDLHYFTVGKGATVTFDADGLDGDFAMKQGAYLTIKDGASWVQTANDEWGENRWTELDLSALTLDNGSFLRTGSVREEGGGALIFGSWRGDDTFDDPGLDLDHQEILIDIKNGGKLVNEGQVWFGAFGDTAPNGTTITMTINNGSLDLTGGDVSIDGAVGDLIFTNRFIPGIDPDSDQPKYAINFTGPGSITVDAAGVVVTNLNENGEWENLVPTSYQSLWDAGLLQADGKSGKTGASFSTYFTVSGTVGGENYKLTRSGNPVVTGDFNNDGVLSAADIDMLSAEVKAGANKAGYDLNSDNLVNADDRKVWVETLKKTYFGDSNLDGQFDSTDFVDVFQIGEYEDATAGNSTWADGDWDGNGDFDSGDFVEAFQGGGYNVGPRAAVAAVPEPSALVLFGLAGLGIVARRRK